MKTTARIVAGIACASVLIAVQAQTRTPEDSRITHYKEQVHLTADQLRVKTREVANWQRNNWIAPRVCSGSTLSWASVPAGKTATLYDCAPFQCAPEGFCKQTCSSDATCASGAKCVDTDASGQNGVCIER